MTIRSRPSALAFLAALAVAAPASSLAHPHPEGEGRKHDRVIILEKHEGGPGKRLRAFHADRAAMKCDGEDATKIEETSQDEKTKFFFCHDGKASPAAKADRLEKALSRIRAEDHLSPEHKARVEAAMQQAIGRLRAAN